MNHLLLTALSTCPGRPVSNIVQKSIDPPCPQSNLVVQLPGHLAIIGGYSNISRISATYIAMAGRQVLEQGSPYRFERQTRLRVDRPRDTRRDLSLAELPTEVLLLIGDELDDEENALAALALTSRRLNQVFEPLLYRSNAKLSASVSALIWGAAQNRVGTMAKATKAMKSRSGVNLDIYGPDPITPSLFSWGNALHWAARHGNDEAVKFLLKKGASLSLPAIGLCHCPTGGLPGPARSDAYGGEYVPVDHKTGCLPLHLAICSRHTSTAELLMSNGAPYQMCTSTDSDSEFDSESDSDSSDSDDGQKKSAVIGAIHSAAACGLPELFETMVQNAASRQGDWATCPLPEGSTNIVNRWSPFGYPLHFAVCSRSRVRETITALVKFGADVNLTRDGGPTPLFLAVERGDWEAADTLLDLGADPGLPPGMEAEMPLLFRAIQSTAHHEAPRCDENKEAWQNGRDNIIRRLVGLGFDLNKPNWGGLTALTWCATASMDSDSTTGVIPLLFDLGADLNGIDGEGNTVLYNLVDWIHPFCSDLFQINKEAIDFVLKNGASKSLQEKCGHGLTPIRLFIGKLPSLKFIGRNERMKILINFLRYHADLTERQITDIRAAMDKVSEEPDD